MRWEKMSAKEQGKCMPTVSGNQPWLIGYVAVEAMVVRPSRMASDLIQSCKFLEMLAVVALHQEYRIICYH